MRWSVLLGIGIDLYRLIRIVPFVRWGPDTMYCLCFRFVTWNAEPYGMSDSKIEREKELQSGSFLCRVRPLRTFL